MARGTIITPLRAWRATKGYTMEQAGACIVIDGKTVDRSTWHGWERGRKVPTPRYMFEIERVTGCPPNEFYDRPADPPAPMRDPAHKQLALV